MAEKVNLSGSAMSQSLEIPYRDPKAESIDGFGMIVNFMWRRAYFMLKQVIESGVKVRVLDPCAGGCKLLSKADKGFHITGYEPDYANWYFGHNYLKQNNYQAEIINDCFESHFVDAHPFNFHLVISIPYTDHQINAAYDTDLTYLKIADYVFYTMMRSIDVLVDKGVGVFCIPKEYVESEKYVEQVDMVMKKADITSVESYNQYSIIILQKK